MIIKGTHGTCSSNADSIRANGFTCSKVALRGEGVYFWGYMSDELEIYARDLAIAWWRFAKKRGDYANMANQNCSVIFVHLNVEDQDILDFEDPQIREKFIIFYQKVFEKFEGKSEIEKISDTYNRFVNKLEKSIGKTFSMLHVKVQAPKRYEKMLPIDITGQPSCYVVRDLECIEINKFEENKNE
jgi:hypothetical protein